MIRFRFDGIPPSSNNAYATLRTGRRVTTTVGKVYLKETQVEAGKQALLHKIDPDKIYNFIYKVIVPDEEVYTKGFPKTAKSRFHQWDISNRCKIFEDALKKGIGIDDANFFLVIGQKVPGGPAAAHETLAYVWSPEDTETWSIDRLLTII